MLVFHDNDELTNKPNDEQMMNQMMILEMQNIKVFGALEYVGDN